MESPKTALPYLPISSASLIHSCLPPPQNPPHPPVPCPLPTPPPRLRLAHPHAFFLHPLPPWWLFGCTWLRSMSMPQRSTTISCRARSRPLFDCLIIYIYIWRKDRIHWCSGRLQEQSASHDSRSITITPRRKKLHGIMHSPRIIALECRPSMARCYHVWSTCKMHPPYRKK